VESFQINMRRTMSFGGMRILNHWLVAFGTSAAALAVTNQPNKGVNANSCQPGHTQGPSFSSCRGRGGRTVKAVLEAKGGDSFILDGPESPTKTKKKSYPSHDEPPNYVRSTGLFL
jgi:hypothetical protein